jgi:leucyl aminopeptidase
MSLIVGVYDKGLGLSTDAAKNILTDLAETDLVLKTKWELGKTRLAYLNKAKYQRVVLVGLGDELQNATKVDLTSQEQIENEILTPSPQQKYKQNNKIKIEEQFTNIDHGEWSFVIADKIRDAVQEAVKLLIKDDRKSTHEIFVDTLLAGEKFEHQAVEGAFFGTYEFKLPDSAQYDVTDQEEKPIVMVPLQGESETWKKAKIYAQSQLLAALVSEMPANLMTPTIFAETMRNHFKDIKNVQVEIHDRKWASDLEVCIHKHFILILQDEFIPCCCPRFRGRTKSFRSDLHWQPIIKRNRSHTHW